MKLILFKLMSCLLLLTASCTSWADESAQRQTLSQLNLSNIEIIPSPLPGYNVIFATEGVFFLSEDGRFLIEGEIYDMYKKPAENILNPLLNKKVNELAEQEAIVYKAPEEKYVVTVFTDITCTYCKKLHDEIDDYNKEGITIRYLAYPRAGVESGSGKKMQSIWCMDNPKSLLTSAFKNEFVPDEVCSPKKSDISRHFSLGRQLGLQGTPGIVLTNGQVISGYLSAEALKQELSKRSN